MSNVPAAPQEPEMLPDEIRMSAFKAGRSAWARLYPGLEDSDGVVDLVTGYVLDAVAAALAGRTVVALPEPDGVDENGDTWWEYPGGKAWSRANGRFDDQTAARFRGMAAAMLAAVEHNERKHAAERLASESRKDGET